MGICRCKEGKSCSVHFFRKHVNPDKYIEEKKSFERKHTKKSYKKKEVRTPEYDIE